VGDCRHFDRREFSAQCREIAEVLSHLARAPTEARHFDEFALAAIHASLGNRPAYAG
jgi:hypothetical protein